MSAQLSDENPDSPVLRKRVKFLKDEEDFNEIFFEKFIALNPLYFEDEEGKEEYSQSNFIKSDFSLDI